MSALLLIVLVGVAVVLTVRTARRGLSDHHTVEEHHRTLDTLGEIAQHHDPAAPLPPEPPSARPHVRVMPPGKNPTTRPGQPVRWPDVPSPPPLVETPPPPVVETPPPNPLIETPPPQPVGQTSSPAKTPPLEPAITPPPARPGPDDWPALVFDDIDDPTPWAQEPLGPVVAALGEAPALSASITPPPPMPSRLAPVPPEPAAPLVASTLGRGKVATKPPRWHRRTIAGLSAAATIAVLVGVAALVTSIGNGGAAHRSTAAPAPTLASPPPTVAPKASAVLIDSNSQGARYSVAPSAASIELVPTSACWVQIRTGSANGPVVFQGTMHAGDRMPLPTSGPVWLRLGNPPAVSIVVNGTPLHLVTPSVAQPYNLEFQPAG